mgnify:CR=1 FL=1
MTILPLLAWTPFLQPLPLDDHWLWLVIPIVVIISIVYKTIKVEDLNTLPKQAAMLATQIFVFMALAAAGLYLLSEIF